MNKEKKDEKVFIVCPACGYLVEARYILPNRSDGVQECKNCGAQVGWSTYENHAFPYIKKDKK